MKQMDRPLTNVQLLIEMAQRLGEHRIAELIRRETGSNPPDFPLSGPGIKDPSVRLKELHAIRRKKRLGS